MLGVLLVAEHWSPAQTPFVAPTGTNLPPVYRWLASESAGPLIELPVYPDRIKRQRAVYLYFSTIHWRPIPIGRTSFYPPAHDYLAWNLRDFPDHDSVEILRRLGVRTLVLHPRLWREPKRTDHLAVIDADPRLTLVRRFDGDAPNTAPELALGDERVYRIAGDAAAPAPAFPCEPAVDLPREDWVLEHSGRKLPNLARDADTRTAWFTRDPMRPGDFFQIVLPRAARVAAVAIRFSYPYDEFPRNLTLESTRDGRTWQAWPFHDSLDESWQVIADLVRRPREARIVLRPEPAEVKGIRLSVARAGWDDAWPQWRIAEIRLHSECRPADARTRVIASDAGPEPR
jgi:hypothetical protein